MDDPNESAQPDGSSHLWGIGSFVELRSREGPSDVEGAVRMGDRAPSLSGRLRPLGSGVVQVLTSAGVPVSSPGFSPFKLAPFVMLPGEEEGPPTLVKNCAALEELSTRRRFLSFRKAEGTL